jgi:hypothetical protein
MQIENHPWIEQLARELAEPRLSVGVVAKPVWAPELIGGVARCQRAEFIALGTAGRSEASIVRASPIVRQIVRATPCPVLTV